jgi:hypothetical protein
LGDKQIAYFPPFATCLSSKAVAATHLKTKQYAIWKSAFSKPACPSRDSDSIISIVKEWKRHLKNMNLRHLLLSTAP